MNYNLELQKTRLKKEAAPLSEARINLLKQAGQIADANNDLDRGFHFQLEIITRKVNTLKKIILRVSLVIGFFFLYACPMAPHYYKYSSMKNEKYQNSRFDIYYKLYSMHLPGNSVDVWSSLKLKNKTNDTVIIDDYIFNASSSKFKYNLDFIAERKEVKKMEFEYIPIYKKTKGSIIKNKIMVLPKDSISILVIFKNLKKINEKEYKKLWEKDTLNISIQLDNEKYKYKFISDMDE